MSADEKYTRHKEHCRRCRRVDDTLGGSRCAIGVLLVRRANKELNG